MRIYPVTSKERTYARQIAARIYEELGKTRTGVLERLELTALSALANAARTYPWDGTVFLRWARPRIEAAVRSAARDAKKPSGQMKTTYRNVHDAAGRAISRLNTVDPQILNDRSWKGQKS